MEERETGKRRRREEEAEAAIAIAPKKRVEGGNILCADDKEIAIVEKRILTRDTHRQKTSWVLKNTQWSDFPIDLLMLVAERLTSADHIRMSTTCKSWQCAAPSFLFSKTPVLLFIENNRSYFFDPLSKMKWATYIPEVVDANFHYSKGGWLLLSLSHNNNQSQFFFFNPFTNEKINLPIFYPDTSFNPSFCEPGAFVVSFSSLPTSQDCVIFLLSAMTYHSPRTHRSHSFYVYYQCSHKDMAWEWKRRFQTDGSGHFNDLLQTPTACYKNPLSFNGFFYYQNTNGTLSIIKLIEKTTMTQYVRKPRQLLPESEHYDCYLVESQGEILSIFFCNGNKKIRVFQVDHSVVHSDSDQDKWIELKSLRDNIFFLDRSSSLSMVVKGGEMIHFPKFQKGCNDFEEPARRIWVDPNFILKTL